MPKKSKTPRKKTAKSTTGTSVNNLLTPPNSSNAKPGEIHVDQKVAAESPKHEHAGSDVAGQASTKSNQPKNNLAANSPSESSVELASTSLLPPKSPELKPAEASQPKSAEVEPVELADAPPSTPEGSIKLELTGSAKTEQDSPKSVHAGAEEEARQPELEAADPKSVSKSPARSPQYEPMVADLQTVSELGDAEPKNASLLPAEASQPEPAEAGLANVPPTPGSVKLELAEEAEASVNALPSPESRKPELAVADPIPELADAEPAINATELKTHVESSRSPVVSHHPKPAESPKIELNLQERLETLREKETAATSKLEEAIHQLLEQKMGILEENIEAVIVYQEGEKKAACQQVLDAVIKAKKVKSENPSEFKAAVEKAEQMAQQTLEMLAGAVESENNSNYEALPMHMPGDEPKEEHENKEEQETDELLIKLRRLNKQTEEMLAELRGHLKTIEPSPVVLSDSLSPVLPPFNPRTPEINFLLNAPKK